MCPMNLSQITSSMFSQPWVATNQPPPQVLQVLDQAYAFPWMNRKMELMKYANPRSLEFASLKPRTGNNKKTIRSSNMYKRPQVRSSNMYKRPKASNELQNQNQNQKRLKGQKFYQKKKLPGFAPHAPRNTSSFLIRARECGGVADLASPYPVTPFVLPTPNLSPIGDIVGDMAKEEWGVNGYGSMEGLIQIRSPGYDYDEVERRLDHDVSRFEMIPPANNRSDLVVEEDRVEIEESSNDSHHEYEHEGDSLSLKNRLCLMENQIREFEIRLQCLENE